MCVCFFRNTFYVLMEIGRPLFTKSGSFIKSRKKGKFGMDFLLPRERENRRTNVNLTLNTLRNVCVFPSFSMRHFYQTIYQFSKAHFLLTHRVSRSLSRASRPSFFVFFEMNNQTEKMLRIYEEWNIGARVPDCKPETRQVWYRSIETFKVFGLLIFLGHPFTFHHEGNNKIKSTAEDKTANRFFVPRLIESFHEPHSFHKHCRCFVFFSSEKQKSMPKEYRSKNKKKQAYEIRQMTGNRNRVPHVNP